MAEDDDKDSRSEAPTEKRIRETLEKGKVPFSRETTTFFSILAILLVLGFYLPQFVSDSAALLRDLLANATAWPLDTPSSALNLFFAIGKFLLLAMMPVIAPIFLLGFLSAIGQNQPRLIANRIKPELSKVSPLKGLKRLFGKQTMTEFGRAMFKFSVAGIVASIAGFWHYQSVLGHLLLDVNTIPASLHSLAISVVTSLSVFLVVLAVADLFYVRHEWMDEMKMSKQDIKDEVKQSEGDPIVKQRTLSLARDRARRRMMGEVPTASLVITNPTHFAVAMRYEPGKDKVPKVVAKGQDLLALKIREIAEANDIPIVEDKPLARSLYKAVKIDALLPAEFYVPVARIIRMVLDRENNSSLLPEGGAA